MNRKDVIDIINRYISDKSEIPALYEALLVAVEALNVPENPWVRTARRCAAIPKSLNDQEFLFHGFFTREGHLIAIIEDQEGRILQLEPCGIKFTDRDTAHPTAGGNMKKGGF